MRQMKNIEIELHNSSKLTKYMEHRITVLEEQLREANLQIKGKRKEE